MSPGIEYTPPSSPGAVRAHHPHSGHPHVHSHSHSFFSHDIPASSVPNSPSHSHSYSHVPSIPQWGSAGNLIEKYGVGNSSSASLSSGISTNTSNSTSSTNGPVVPSHSLASIPSVVSLSSGNLLAMNTSSTTLDANNRPTSPTTVPSVIAKLASSADLSNAAGIILINGSKWRGTTFLIHTFNVG